MDRLEASTNIKHVAQGWQSEGNTGTPWLGRCTRFNKGIIQ